MYVQEGGWSWPRCGAVLPKSCSFSLGAAAAQRKLWVSCAKLDPLPCSVSPWISQPGWEFSTKSHSCESCFLCNFAFQLNNSFLLFSNGKNFTGVHITLEKLLVQVLLGALNVQFQSIGCCLKNTTVGIPNIYIRISGVF